MADATDSDLEDVFQGTVIRIRLPDRFKSDLPSAVAWHIISNHDIRVSKYSEIV